MEKKILIKGNLIAVCPECGNEIPVSVMDIANEAEIICPCGKFHAHNAEHTLNKYTWCGDECPTSFERHSFTLSKDNIAEVCEVI